MQQFSFAHKQRTERGKNACFKAVQVKVSKEEMCLFFVCLFK